jgi:hypothetical protein
MVIPTRGQEHRVASMPLRHLEPQNIPIEGQRSIDIGDLQVHMADPDVRLDSSIRHAGLWRAHPPRFCEQSRQSMPLVTPPVVACG